MSVLHVNQGSFQSVVKESTQPVLVDFWATWCGPCRMIAPVLEEIAEERQDIKVCKVDVDQEMALASAFKIVSIPTLLVVKNGVVTNKAVGAMPKEQILALL